MGVAININVNNENEFNQQLQMYLAQGYHMQSNFNGTAILSKKNYSTDLLIVLIIFGFCILGIIYYLIASNDVVTITTNENNASATSDPNNKNFSSYCPNCGHGLYNDSRFCPGCGKNLNEDNEESNEIIVEEKTDENELSILENADVETAYITKHICKNCGEKLTEDEKFCPNCGEDLTL